MTDWFSRHQIKLERVPFAELARARLAASTLYGAAPLFPTFDPARTHIDGIAWVGTRDKRLMATGAAVIRECPDGLKKAVEELSIFSDVVAPGEWAELRSETAMLGEVRGRTVVLGAVWKAPEVGKGFLAAFWPVLVAASLDDLKADWLVGMIRGEKRVKLGFEIESFRHCWEGLVYCDPSWGGEYQSEEFSIFAMSRLEAEERVLRRARP